MAKVNLAGSIDRALLKRANILATKTETSVNALLNKELRYLTSTFEAAESSSHQNVISLLDVSLGRLNDLEVKDHLGIDSDEDLFLLMAQAHLPMPRLSSETTQDMVASLNALSA
ncbi:MAG: hypothetical protein EB071_12885 [Gammaproteobacteria bacterium]|nr:hypothetical protein [Gammaproteobacteria bacterium]